MQSSYRIQSSCRALNVMFVAVFMLLACIIYPSGWDAAAVRQLCNSDSYDSGNCYIQWTYYLAIVAIFDAIVLAVLAFILAVRYVRLLPWQGKTILLASVWDIIWGLKNTKAQKWHIGHWQGWTEYTNHNTVWKWKWYVGLKDRNNFGIEYHQNMNTFKLKKFQLCMAFNE